MDLRWFNLGAPVIRVRIPGRFFPVRIKLWNLFRNCSNYGHQWGIGLLQIGKRHLFFVGFCGVSVLFFGKTD